MTVVGSPQRPAGAPDAPAGVQASLNGELVAAMTADTPSIEHLLALVHRHLGDCAGLRACSVFTLDAEAGRLDRVSGRGRAAADDADLAGAVFRAPAGGPPVRAGDRLAVRLRIGGQTVGVLVLTGDDLPVLQPDVVAGIAVALAGTVASLAAERSRQYVAHATSVIRTLFEQGSVVAGVEEAGLLLARMTAEAFHTEHAGVHLVDQRGRIKYARGVKLGPEGDAELRRSLLGKIASESPVWQATAAAGGPLLVDDVDASPVRQGGFVQTMGLRAYIAMPLMSAGGAVGMVVCGDATGTRRWSRADRVLARQLAVEGAMIVDSARLRDAEAQHVAELTRRAYHDALTGLPNRAQLLLTANRAVAAATRAGRRTALLLLDLDGFKNVNDTVGHHAGDALLQQVGDRLRDAVRDNDLVARLGGDEFAVLLTRDPDEHAAETIAERIHERLSEPYLIDGRPLRVGASIGIAVCPDSATDVAGLLRRADSAMYRAKRHGGGCRLFISP